MESIAKTYCSQKSFFQVIGIDFCGLFVFSGGLGSSLSGFLVLENGLGNEWIFGVERDLGKWICQGESTSDLGPANSLTADA